MNYAILHMKEGLCGLNVHEHPGSMPPIDAIEPDVWMQWVGTPEVAIGLTTWIEVTYCRPRPRSMPQRGWIAKHQVDVVKDKMFVENLTVHERQVEYEKSVSFPKPPDIPKFDRECMPECEPIPRGLWLVAGLAALCVLGVLFKAFLHIP